MRKIIVAGVFILLFSLMHSLHVDALDISGYISAQGRFFFNDPLYPGQDRNNASVAMQQEYYHEWENGSSVIFVPFIRIDSVDQERTHADIRELNYLWLSDDVELRAGIGKVFWGVTEFVHLVDIINQTDLVEHIDGEEKLGQPMVQLIVPGRWGTLEFFLLPYFRERTFPGEHGRLRGVLPVDTDNAEYESSHKEKHIDIALRYSKTLGDLDLGIYHFRGTGREPDLLVEFDSFGRPHLIPFYGQIDQTGLDAQYVKGSWLFKLESLYRSGQGDDNFFASVSGFEYSFVNIASSGIDIGVIGEWAYDERGVDASTPFDNDVMVGARIAFNDAASSEALLGVSYDVNGDGQIFTLESSRRFGNNWKAVLESFFVIDSSENDFIHAFRDDDYVLFELSYYF